MGNSFAYFILLLWPIVAVFLYRKYSIQKATILVLLGGFLFLPVKTTFNFPFIPEFNKYSISTLACIFCCLFIKRKSIGFFNNKGLMRFLVLLMIVSPFFTVMTNSDAVIVGKTYLPGLKNYDAISLLVNQILFMFPFFIGRRFFSTYENQLLLFKMVVGAGLIYSILILIEVRLSPQLHNWIYGYFPHEDFRQQYRFGGFRPVGFIGHGLEVAFFIATALICSIALVLNKVSIKPFTSKISTVYLSIILLFCKTVGAFVYATTSLLFISIFSPKRVKYIALALATIAFTYPILQISNLFPDDKIVNLAEGFNAERAGSLEFRFEHEQVLLEKAYEKYVFGWGTWGRNRIFDDSGEDISVTDGLWIIKFGQFGFVGFIYYFGIMYLTLIYANRAFNKSVSSNEKIFLAVHMLLVAIIMIDQLPNSSLVPWYWFVIGTLVGRAEFILSQTNINMLNKETP